MADVEYSKRLIGSEVKFSGSGNVESTDPIGNIYIRDSTGATHRVCPDSPALDLRSSAIPQDGEVWLCKLANADVLINLANADVLINLFRADGEWITNAGIYVEDTTPIRKVF